MNFRSESDPIDIYKSNLVRFEHFLKIVVYMYIYADLAMHNICINPKGKLILSPQEKRQWPRFKVSSKGLSTEIVILIRSPTQRLTEPNDD